MKKRFEIFMILSICMSAIVMAQWDSSHPSSDLISTGSSTFTLVNVYDIICWRVDLGEDYLLVADLGQTVHLMDIENRNEPEEVGTYRSPSAVFGMEQISDLLYIADRDSGLIIVDISNPARPVRLGKYDHEAPALDAFAVKGSYAYLSNRSGRTDNFTIVDISNPATPVHVHTASLPWSFYSIIIRDNYAFSKTNSNLYIINIMDPLAPIVIGEAPFGTSSYPCISVDGLVVDGNHIYVANRNFHYPEYTIFLIYNIEELENPILSSSYQFNTLTGIPDVCVSSGYAYFSAGELGLYVFDISSPGAPTLVDSLDTPGFTQNIVLIDNYLYVSDFWSLLIFQSSLISDVNEKEISILTDFKLEQNYPNPFNPATEITYTIPQPAHVTLKIYNIKGEEVATLVDSKRQEGEYTVRWDASGFSSGVYLYRLEAGPYTETRRMVLLR